MNEESINQAAKILFHSDIIPETFLRSLPTAVRRLTQARLRCGMFLSSLYNRLKEENKFETTHKYPIIYANSTTPH